MTAARLRSGIAFVTLLAFGCAADEDPEGDDGSEAQTEGGETEAGEESSGSAADTGMMQLTFTVGGAVPGSDNLVDPLMGTVYGGVYRTADVGATGPRDGAEQFAYVEAPGVDLEIAMVSTAMWTSEPLPPDTYTFLGFFDVDGSSASMEEKDPEDGDPVTLPTANTVSVEAGATAMLVVTFDLVL